MSNNQLKRERARIHNEKREQARINKLNNDYARDNFSISLSYFIRVVLGNSNPKEVRKDMRDYEKPEVPEGMDEEKIAECITHLTNKSNEQGRNMVWEQSIQELSTELSLNGIQASYAFARWAEYMDNRKTLAKAINFD